VTVPLVAQRCVSSQNCVQSGDIESDSFDRRPDAARGKRAPAGRQQQEEESLEDSDDGIGSEVKRPIN
jgi:hypothetical protein